MKTPNEITNVKHKKRELISLEIAQTNCRIAQGFESGLDGAAVAGLLFYYLLLLCWYQVVEKATEFPKYQPFPGSSIVAHRQCSCNRNKIKRTLVCVLLNSTPERI